MECAIGGRGDIAIIKEELRNMQGLHQDHADRLARLERRQDDEAKLRSVWGSASPFPSLLSGTPQPGREPEPLDLLQANKSSLGKIPQPSGRDISWL